MQVRRVNRVNVYVLTTALLLSAAALSVASTSSAEATTTNTIVISNFMFKPMVLRVKPGAVIKVINKDTVVHTVTAVNGSFKTSNIFPNKTKSFKAPRKAGTYHYFCSVHTFMKGTIIVK